jgi:hypothetical protein
MRVYLLNVGGDVAGRNDVGWFIEAADQYLNLVVESIQFAKNLKLPTQSGTIPPDVRF